ncbi:MAG: UPF0280 family protein [Pseudomonadota bacterium]
MMAPVHPPLRLPPDWPAGALAAALPDGRLHLRHGPIELLITAEGTGEAQRAATRTALATFATVLTGLVAELEALRRPAGSAAGALEGPIARRMLGAVAPLAGERFVTPMAAVAGAVADHVAGAMWAAAPLHRLIVNNGGDVALRLAPGATARLLLCTDPAPGAPRAAGTVEIGAADGIGGIATSGWRGRSHSLGIADAVTVFAADAASADAAATLVANATDLPGEPMLAPYVERRPARALAPDSDLGDRPVTTAVAPLPVPLARAALARGRTLAASIAARGLIHGAHLALGREHALAGRPPHLSLPPSLPSPVTDGRRSAGGRSKARGVSPATRERAPAGQATGQAPHQEPAP